MDITYLNINNSIIKYRDQINSNNSLIINIKRYGINNQMKNIIRELYKNKPIGLYIENLILRDDSKNIKDANNLIKFITDSNNIALESFSNIIKNIVKYIKKVFQWFYDKLVYLYEFISNKEIFIPENLQFISVTNANEDINIDNKVLNRKINKEEYVTEASKKLVALHCRDIPISIKLVREFHKRINNLISIIDNVSTIQIQPNELRKIINDINTLNNNDIYRKELTRLLTETKDTILNKGFGYDDDGTITREFNLATRIGNEFFKYKYSESSYVLSNLKKNTSKLLDKAANLDIISNKDYTNIPQDMLSEYSSCLLNSTKLLTNFYKLIRIIRSTYETVSETINSCSLI